MEYKKGFFSRFLCNSTNFFSKHVFVGDFTTAKVENGIICDEPSVDAFDLKSCLCPCVFAADSAEV